MKNEHGLPEEGRDEYLSLDAASNQDRDEAAALPGDAFAEGRLGKDQLDELCAAAYAATTGGELADLTADLPVVRMEVSPRSGTVAPRRVRQPE